MKDMFGTGTGGSSSSGFCGGGGVSGGQSIKDRMKAFNNNSGTSVNFDPVHFAVRQNKAEKGTNDDTMILYEIDIL